MLSGLQLKCCLWNTPIMFHKPISFTQTDTPLIATLSLVCFAQIPAERIHVFIEQAASREPLALLEWQVEMGFFLTSVTVQMSQGLPVAEMSQRRHHPLSIITHKWSHTHSLVHIADNVQFPRDYLYGREWIIQTFTDAHTHLHILTFT